MSKHALSLGIMFFSFGMILLGLSQTTVEGTVTIFWLKLPVFPKEFYTGLGILVVATSVALMVAVFYKRFADAVERFLEEQPKSRSQAFIRWFLFVVFWLVYFVGWIKGLASISAEELVFHVVFWIGFVWFFIIPIVWLTPAFRRLKL